MMTENRILPVILAAAFPGTAEVWYSNNNHACSMWWTFADRLGPDGQEAVHIGPVKLVDQNGNHSNCVIGSHEVQCTIVLREFYES